MAVFFVSVFVQRGSLIARESVCGVRIVICVACVTAPVYPCVSVARFVCVRHCVCEVVHYRSMVELQWILRLYSAYLGHLRFF